MPVTGGFGTLDFFQPAVDTPQQEVEGWIEAGIPHGRLGVNGERHSTGLFRFDIPGYSAYFHFILLRIPGRTNIFSKFPRHWANARIVKHSAPMIGVVCGADLYSGNGKKQWGRLPERAEALP